MIHPSTFLSRALLADAIFSGVSAVGLTLGAGMLAPFLNLPEALLRETGLFLIAYTALVGWLASRSSVPKALVLLVIVGNAAWTLGSFALLFSGAVSPNLLGQAVTVAQAIATGVFAELQYVGLRKSGPNSSAGHRPAPDWARAPSARGRWRPARRFERGIVERALRKGRRKTRRDQEHVAFTQGNLQSCGELQHHFARRRGAAGFHKAEVTRGYLGIARQIELA